MCVCVCVRDCVCVCVRESLCVCPCVRVPFIFHVDKFVVVCKQMIGSCTVFFVKAGAVA